MINFFFPNETNTRQTENGYKSIRTQRREYPADRKITNKTRKTKEKKCILFVFIVYALHAAYVYCTTAKYYFIIGVKRSHDRRTSSHRYCSRTKCIYDAFRACNENFKRWKNKKCQPYSTRQITKL